MMNFDQDPLTLREQILQTFEEGFQERRRIAQEKVGSPEVQTASLIRRTLRQAFLAAADAESDEIKLRDNELQCTTVLCMELVWPPDYQIPLEAGKSPEQFNPEWLRGAKRIFWDVLGLAITDPRMNQRFTLSIESSVEPGFSSVWHIAIRCAVPDDLRPVRISSGKDLDPLFDVGDYADFGFPQRAPRLVQAVPQILPSGSALRTLLIGLAALVADLLGMLGVIIMPLSKTAKASGIVITFLLALAIAYGIFRRIKWEEHQVRS